MKTQLLVLGGLMIAGCSPSGPEEVSFKGYKEFELKGTVLAPGGIGRKSAVLLLPGSGPTDR
ncbi:MAG TPA: hypothetical protein VEX38_05795, partial [Fimbriimonadaceae bacterium]|nr:hypothetical protein [Fimbriimonadaceae bacterium]